MTPAFTHITHSADPIDAIVCLSGSAPSLDLLNMFAQVPVIAADGAANMLYALGVLPEFIVGDLDSIQPDVLEAARSTSELVIEIDQEINDFEKALRFAQQMLWNRVLITGIHGGDLEHTLNNWSVLMRYGQRMDLIAIDGNRLGIPVYAHTSYSARVDESVSLIPQPSATLTTRGLHWSLTQEVLSLGVREGHHNRATLEHIEVEIHEGAIFMFIDAQLPLLPKGSDSAILRDDA